MTQTLSDLKTVRFNEQVDGVIILDQALLPDRETYLTLTTAEKIWDVIYKLEACGAPTIEVAVAYDIYVCARRIDTAKKSIFMNGFRRIKEYLAGSRPTAMSLVATLNQMERVLVAYPTLSVPKWRELLHKETITIREEDAATYRQIGENRLELLRPEMGILTHCNAGHLAVSEYGAALASIYLGQERGYGLKVFVDETHLLLQGARSMAYELSRAGVDVTLICDSMASVVMRKGWVHAVVVGCNRVAANSDVVNKIGTPGMAILARHYKIPSYVLGSTSTIDSSYLDGDSIVIEEHNPDEVIEIQYSKRMAPKDVKVYNPVFDITPHELIAAIVTEKDIPYKNSR